MIKTIATNCMALLTLWPLIQKKNSQLQLREKVKFFCCMCVWLLFFRFGLVWYGLRSVSLPSTFSKRSSTERLMRYVGGQLQLTNIRIHLHGNWISSITWAKRYQLINLLRRMIYQCAMSHLYFNQWKASKQPSIAFDWDG